ncbi:TIM-barrel domain-containing protein [Basilea psittacipulmonis]|uniref:TIM-barrel domain-containing protein n=1 Tax=Basilea psittacipulmonis TaxID=1472345 RepID=UPI000A55B2C8|nr:TIM-barrel domain-containing protein [Basilea psittacipulmonis]
MFRLRFGLKSALELEKAQEALHINTEFETTEIEVIDDKVYKLIVDSYEMHIYPSPFRLEWYHSGKLITRTSLLYEQAPLAWQLDDEKRPSDWGLMLDLKDDTRLYGLGSCADLSRRGDRVLSSDEGYQPFVYANDGWGVFLNHWGEASHHLASDHPNTYEIYAKSAVLDLWVMLGTPSQIFNHFSNITKPALYVPIWSLAPTLNQLPQQSNTDFIAIASKYRETSFGLNNLRFSLPSFADFAQNKLQLEWSDSRQTNLELFFDHLHNEKWHIYAPTLPIIKVGTPLFEELEDRGWLLQDEAGNAFLFEGHLVHTSEKFALLDITYKDAMELWVEWHRVATAQMLDGMVTELPIPSFDGVYARMGQTGSYLHQLYTLYLEDAVQKAMKDHRVPSEAIAFNGPFSAYSQRYLWQEVRTDESSWAGLEYLIRESLSLQNSGCIAPSIRLTASLLKNSSDEFLMRLLSFVVFSTGFSIDACEDLLRLTHSKYKDVFEHLLNLRMRMLPYVYGLIEEGIRSGVPVQRSLPLSFPDDPEVDAYPHEYLFGDALLMCPVFEADQDETAVYLPKGSAWWDLNTGQRYEGGQLITVASPVGTVVAFGREGYILCLGPDMQTTEDFNTAKILEEVWMFDMPLVDPLVMRNKIRVMHMQGSSYLKGLEGLKIFCLPGIEVKRRGSEVRISRER